MRRRAPDGSIRTMIVAVAVTACSAATASAQGVDTLAALRTPLSPAFALMGITPASIERPTTPRAFSAAILSATDNLTMLPDSWAVEVAPYWLRPHPTLTYEDYYGASLPQAILQSLAISIATSRPDSTADATDLGLGLRFRVVEGEEDSESKAIRGQLTTIQQEITGLNSQRRRALREGRQADADSLDGVIEARADDARKRALELQDHQDLVGWTVDLALASAWAFPTPAFESGRNTSWGAWTTVGYRWEKPDFQLLLLGRFINNAQAEDQNVFDGGLRWIWDLDRLDLSIEGVRRIALDIQQDPDVTNISLRSSGRLIGGVEYRITDTAYLYASFGKDHKPAGEARHPLLAIAGLSLDFGALPTLLRASP